MSERLLLDPLEEKCDEESIVSIKGKPTTGVPRFAHRKPKTLALLVVLVLVTFVLCAGLPPAKGMDGKPILVDYHGRATLGVCFLVLTLWTTRALDFAATALLGMALLSILGALPFSETVKNGLGDPIIPFFLAVLILASAFIRSGLGRRLSSVVLSISRGRRDLILLGFLVSGAVLAMWLTAMASAAIMAPMAAAVLREGGGMEGARLRRRKQQDGSIYTGPFDNPDESSPFSKALMLSCAWGPAFGGLMTPIGAGPNLIALAFIRRIMGVDMSFLQWMVVGVPVGVIMIAVCWFSMVWFCEDRQDPWETPWGPSEGNERRKAGPDLSLAYDSSFIAGDSSGRLTKSEVVTSITIVSTIALWFALPLLRGLGLNISVHSIALISSTIVLVPCFGVLTWEDVYSDVDLGSILVIATGMSLGHALLETGAIRWLGAWVLIPIMTMTPCVRIFLAAVGISVLKTFLSSNTVAGAVLVPLVVAMAGSLGKEAATLVWPAVLASSFSLIVVTGSPTNMIPFSYGYFSVKDMAIMGAWLTLMSALVITVVVYATWESGFAVL